MGYTCSQALKKRGGGKWKCHSQHKWEKSGFLWLYVFYGFWKIIKKIDGGDNYDGAHDGNMQN